ncbi:hypothetical protein [Nakamurella lactea]|uniref:hypothetical protein n=1 Tax=Nakamurella lactea TaxID=459515 RepID=UPI00048ABD00|nr:hypothetical protein [Nakamurella lactea]
MTAVETAIVELAVPWWWLRVALAVVCIGSLPLMAGMVAGYRIRPHLLTERSLLVRCGNAMEVQIPLSLIASIGTTLGTPPRRPGVVGRALELGIGTTDVVITLRSPQQVPADESGATAEVDRIRCSADDPGTFVRLISDALSRQSLRR